MALRVLVVDDYAPVRRVVRLILQLRNDLEIVGEASDGLEAVQKANELRPDLILLDIGLPTLSGLQVARRLRDQVPSAKVLFLSVESSSDVVREALSLGAVGYVYKLRVASELLPAIDTVLRGKQFVGGDLEGEFGKPTRKYPWQQAVIDASTESRPEHLPVKIRAAERAISARLRGRTLTPQENVAILEALTFLESLMPHKTETKESDAESDDKSEIA